MISKDEALSEPLSQVRDQSEDDNDEILMGSEQVFLPRFVSTRKFASRRKGQVQRRHYVKKKYTQGNNRYSYWGNYWSPWYYPRFQ